MNCVIVDDELMDLTILKELLKSYPDIEVTGAFQNPQEALDFSQTTKVDVLILDIEMPGISGIDFVKSLDAVPHIIFISSNRFYAAESYDYNILDYIVKPLSKDRLTKAIDKLKEVEKSVDVSDGKDFAYVRDGSKIVRIDFSKVLFIEALADYVQINTEEGRYTVLSTMKSLLSKLPKKDFYRVHRSFIIRKDKIKIIEDSLIIMGDKSIPISRSVKQEFFNSLDFL